MAFTENLLVGLAEWLHTNGHGTWSTGPVDTSTVPVIHVGTMPDTPHEVIVLAAAPVRSDPHLSDSVVNVQIRTRGLPVTAGGRTTGAANIADPIVDALHGLRDVDFGGIWVERIDHIGGASMGADEQGRSEWSDNFQFDLLRPTPLRT